MEKNKIIKYFVLFIILIIAFKILFLNKSLYIISEDNKSILVNNIKATDEIHLSYLQSLYKTMQTEVLHIDGESLVLDKVAFGDLNSLYYYDEQNLNYIVDNDRIWLMDLNESFDKISIRANYSKTHLLEIIRDDKIYKEIKFSEEFESGRKLTMGVTNNLKAFLMKHNLDIFLRKES